MKKVLVRGPALSRSGYGEHCRFLLRSLQMIEDQLDIYIINTEWGQLSWVSEDNEQRRWIDKILEKTVQYRNSGGQFDMSIQVTIPNEWEKLAPVNIGVTAGIETTLVSPQWVQRSTVVDRIITISEHSKNVFLNTTYEATNEQTGEKIPDYRCQTPIDVVHYPVREYETEKLDLQLDYDFNFLVNAQWGPRKNLQNTISWFVEEFKNDEVGLVVKTSMIKNNLYDRANSHQTLQNLIASFGETKCKVYLLHGSMTDKEVMSLYKEPKIKEIGRAHV